MERGDGLARYIRSILLPLPRYTGPNGRCHWHQTSEHAKADKAISYSESLAMGYTTRILRPAIIIEWYASSNRRIDVDNCQGRCKYLIDGLTLAGWWEDDSEIEQVTTRRFLPKDGFYKGKVRVLAYSLVGSPQIDPISALPKTPPKP